MQWEQQLTAALKSMLQFFKRIARQLSLPAKVCYTNCSCMCSAANNYKLRSKVCYDFLFFCIYTPLYARPQILLEVIMPIEYYRYGFPYMFVGIPQLILGRKLRAMCPLHFRWARLVVCAHGKCTTETPPEQRVPGVIEEHQIGHYEAE